MGRGPKHARSPSPDSDASSQSLPATVTMKPQRKKQKMDAPRDSGSSGSSPPSTPPKKGTALPGTQPDSNTRIPAQLGPQPPSKPVPGRPAHADRGVRTDKAPDAKLTGLVPATPPRKKPKKKKPADNGFSPHSHSLLSFTTQLPVHLQQSPGGRNTGTSGNRAPKKQGTKVKVSNRGPPLGVSRATHNPNKGWTSAGRAPTATAFKCFETWKKRF
ncbi:hypothetical protein FB45DRAFT_324010 [Roridomyces roridus]|uniref:Uncharacterized protein n=1 Tax=Roridomyces roridus TaxID=1738132 RepID=A0AAD7AWL1_9AGAR|nr:hypothetical protein FB45DRAFT_324010 [Roridomyces roridus]